MNPHALPTDAQDMINPQRMREGYGSRSVCLSVCLSVTTLAGTYLFFKSQVKCHRHF